MTPHDRPASPGVARDCTGSGGVRLCRNVGYVAMPWRNGAGTTLEIAREPATGPDFLWRLSLATIGASGPFSPYAGYRRSVTLVEGAGFELLIAGHTPARLDQIATSTLFSGAAATECRLLSGPCTDLSLMVREPGEISAIQSAMIDRELRFPGAALQRRAIFCVRGAVDCEVDGERFVLASRDTLLFGAPAAAAVLNRPSNGESLILMLAWRTP